jgi:hypothetical protein
LLWVLAPEQKMQFAVSRLGTSSIFLVEENG